MVQDKVFNRKSELRRLAKGDLLKMVFGQPEKNCILGGICPFLLNYQQIRFCASEVLGHGCQTEKLRVLSGTGEAEGKEQNQDRSLDLSDGSYLPGFG